MKIIVPIVLFIVILFTACSPSAIYKEDFDVDENGWNYTDTLSYQFDILNEHENYNLLINLKYNKSYKYNNIFFFVDIEAPNLQNYRDTIECIMANPSGRWLGKISGDYVEHQFMYRYKVNFPEKGNYRVKIQQAMRDSLLKKIASVGIELRTFEELKK